MMGKEVREQIISARKRGISVSELSRIYGVSRRSIYKLQELYRRTGDVTPQTHTRGSKSKIDEQTLEQINQVLQQQPDITLKELREMLDLPITTSQLGRVLRKKLGLPCKKGGKSKIDKQTIEKIDQAVQRHPDITLGELREMLDLPITTSQLSNILRKKLGYPAKKGGGVWKIHMQALEQIDQMVQHQPDITLKELREKLDLPIGESRLSYILRDTLGYSDKINGMRRRIR